MKNEANLVAIPNHRETPIEIDKEDFKKNTKRIDSGKYRTSN